MEERILEILQIARNNSLTKEEVYKKLAYTNLPFEDFEEIFDDMCNKKLIYQTGKNTFIKNPFKEGEVKITKKGDILVKCEDETYTVSENTLGCTNGDTVRIRVTDFNERRATLKEILKRKTISAEVITERGKRYALLKNGNKYKIELDKNIVDEMIIGIKIKQDPKNKEQIAVLDKIIGHKNRPRIDEQMILYENNFEYEWSEDVINEIKNIPSEVSPQDKKGRRDLRDRVIFTIDGADTKDIDDAISIEKLTNGNYLLGVHIADVAHYVKEKTAINNAAYQRATSVYMNTVVNPMYPVELSSGICSLNPNVDRLAMSCEMEIDSNGKLINFDIFESVIHSRKKMTYKDVNKILEENEIPEGYEDYVENLKEMQILASILQKNRIKRGYQNFDLPEVKIITDDEGKPIEIALRSQGTGEKLIESFMLAANETVATYICQIGVPSIYRDHDVPNEERLKRVINIIRNYGEEINIKGKISSPKYIQELLNKVAETERKEVYSNMILRCLAKATYEAYNIGHYSVGINSEIGEAYTHFTSPIRRFPDTTIHRVLKSIIHGKVEELYGDAHKNKMTQIAKHSSTQEQNADKCERESNKMKTAEYLEPHIDEEFEAIIFSFTPTGMYVQLPNLIEGRVGYNTMDDFYNYDEELEMLIGERTKKVYKLGDKVIVKLVRTSKELREIDFEIQTPKVRKK